MRLVYIDSCIWISLVQGLPAYRPPIREAMAQMAVDGWTFCTSGAVRLEVLVKPLRMGRSELVQAYDELLGTCRALAVPDSLFDEACAIAVAEGLRGMDAVHVCIAQRNGCECFLTTDPHFRSLTCIKPRWIDLDAL
jgi:hypothetical protein